uniref:Uncharacterized protein n=1 Tax=Sphaerodactylus townsendi TaxID=933632 RepID=A0ACB8GBS0_9SAUR
MENSDGASNSQAKGNPPAGHSQGKTLRSDGAAAGAELQNSVAVPMLSAMEVAEEPEKAVPRGKDKEPHTYKVLSLLTQLWDLKSYGITKAAQIVKAPGEYAFFVQCTMSVTVGCGDDGDLR